MTASSVVCSPNNTRILLRCRSPRWPTAGTTPSSDSAADLAVRLPQRQLAADLVANEQRWLPELAPRLPLPVPVPLRVGLPSGDYPWNWTVVAWYDGEVAADVALIDPIVDAQRLGRFVRALARAGSR